MNFSLFLLPSTRNQNLKKSIIAYEQIEKNINYKAQLEIFLYYICSHTIFNMGL